MFAVHDVGPVSTGQAELHRPVILGEVAASDQLAEPVMIESNAHGVGLDTRRYRQGFSIPAKSGEEVFGEVRFGADPGRWCMARGWGQGPSGVRSMQKGSVNVVLSSSPSCEHVR